MSPTNESSAFRLAAWTTAINVIIASGFAIAGLVAPQAILPAGAAPGEASFVFALYAAARSLPLAAFALWAIARRNVPALIVLGALAGVVQLLDAGIGLRDDGRPASTALSGYPRAGFFAGPLFTPSRLA